MSWLKGITDSAARAYGAVDKNVFQGVLPGGAQVNPVIGGTVLAAQEAVPAIIQGGLGLGSRKDTSVDPRIAQAVIEAEANAKKRGAPSIAYEDYNDSTSGGFAAKHTFGRVGYNELKRDAQGNVTGIVQSYDTNKTPQQIAQEMQQGAPAYKAAEGLLAMTQGGGMTTHDVNFGQQQPAAKPNYAPNSPMTTKSRKAGDADITVGNTAEPGPATSYAVQAGDTLSAIARQRGVSVEHIANINNISNVDQIGIGQQLKF
jgi:LysM repeat protein